MLLNTQILVQLVEIGLELRIREGVDNAPMLHDVVAIRDGRCPAKVLLDQQDREALLLERLYGLPDLLNDDGGKPLGRLVEQQQPGAGAQNATDGKHLLLAAGKLGALAR